MLLGKNRTAKTNLVGFIRIAESNPQDSILCCVNWIAIQGGVVNLDTICVQSPIDCNPTLNGGFEFSFQEIRVIMRLSQQ